MYYFDKVLRLFLFVLKFLLMRFVVMMRFRIDCNVINNFVGCYILIIRFGWKLNWRIYNMWSCG